ncbi:pentatricopeptide repeat-containing protein At2g33680-like [Phoenix dactylifera]|uniref:Pentatricopeptide repeat-containing protein At2g33680-like n=1 Tax=Phoenix dactylifera TaxID=42345 RepID=A0A8B8JCI3_PHODC|nr:pentatricopeptide repeat-containing protein At2g33680-like [Phoenix dactylifera]
MGDAEKVFSCMPDRGVSTWTVMVSGYAMNGSLEKAMDLFNMMSCGSMISWYSIREKDTMKWHLNCSFQKHANLQLLDNSKGVHSCLQKSAWITIVDVGCALMTIYAKCGELLDVQKVIGEISEHNTVSWSILLAGYAQNGYITEAERIFNGMPERAMQVRAFVLFIDVIKDNMKPSCFTHTSLLNGCSNPQYIRSGITFPMYVIKMGLQSDASIGNSLITVYGEQGNVGDARLIFDTTPWHDVVLRTVIVAAYASNNNAGEAQRFLIRMPQKILISWNKMGNPRSAPDKFYYNHALSACAVIRDLEQARAILSRTVQRGLISDLAVGNAIHRMDKEVESRISMRKCKDQEFSCLGEDAEDQKLFDSTEKNNGICPSRELV